MRVICQNHRWLPINRLSRSAFGAKQFLGSRARNYRFRALSERCVRTHVRPAEGLLPVASHCLVVRAVDKWPAEATAMSPGRPVIHSSGHRGAHTTMNCEGSGATLLREMIGFAVQRLNGFGRRYAVPCPVTESAARIGPTIAMAIATAIGRLVPTPSNCVSSGSARAAASRACSNLAHG